MSREFWTKALEEAERELDAATTRTTINAAARKVMRARAELKRPEAEPADRLSGKLPPASAVAVEAPTARALPGGNHPRRCRLAC